MELNAIKCSNQRCGLILLATNGAAINACPTCHSPVGVIGRVKLQLIIKGQDATDDQIRLLLGQPLPERGPFDE